MTAAGFHDAEAEEVVAACAVASRHGAELAAARLDAGQFHDPRCRLLFVAAVAHRDLVELEERIAVCAATADQHPAWVANMVGARGVMWDEAGTYAARVAAAAERRRRAFELVAQLEALGLDTSAVRIAEVAA